METKEIPIEDITKTLSQCSNNYTIGGIVLEFLDLFGDAFLYAYAFQIIIMIYMYKMVGTGKYWRLMLLGSAFGVFGAIIEHICTAWENALINVNTYTDEHKVRYKAVNLECKLPKHAYTLYIVAEIGWIMSEYAIPLLNLIKLNAVSQGKFTKFLNYVIVFLGLIFAGLRLWIGFERYNEEALYGSNIYRAHGFAFGVTAIADSILSVRIFMELYRNAKKAREKNSENFNVMQRFKQSSLFILFIVDLVSVLLSIISIFGDTYSMNYIVRPFHAFKSNFVLILAIDAIIFKLKAGGGSGSSGGKPSVNELYRQSRQIPSTYAYGGFSIGNSNSNHSNSNSNCNSLEQKNGHGHSSNNNNNNNNTNTFLTSIVTSPSYSTNSIKRDQPSSPYDIYRKSSLADTILGMNPTTTSDGGTLYAGNNTSSTSVPNISPLSGSTITEFNSVTGDLNNLDASTKYKSSVPMTTGLHPPSPNHYYSLNTSIGGNTIDNSNGQPSNLPTSTSKVSGISGIGNIGLGLKYKNISSFGQKSNSTTTSTILNNNKTNLSSHTKPNKNSKKKGNKTNSYSGGNYSKRNSTHLLSHNKNKSLNSLNSYNNNNNTNSNSNIYNYNPFL